MLNHGDVCLRADDKPVKGEATLNFAYEKILTNEEAAKMLQVEALPPTIIAAIGTDGKACSCNVRFPTDQRMETAFFNVVSGLKQRILWYYRLHKFANTLFRGSSF